MRKLAFMAALVSSALATPALARDGAWYVGVEGGGLLVEDLKYDLTTAGGVRTNNAVVVDSNYGFDVGGTVGYDFGAFRLEGEVAYKRAEVDDITMAGGLFCARVACAPPGLQPGGRYNGFGNTQALSFMINGMLDFGADDGLQGFIGGGAGVARVKAGINRTSNQVLLIDDSDTRFAYQGIAGVRAPITQNVDAGLKYRFFNVDDVKLLAGNGRRAETRFRSHSLLFTLAYNFGEPAAPPPPPPPPPPPTDMPPPPPPPPAIPGPFIVFFDWNKSDITAEAAGILDNAAAAYAQTGQASVMLAGHADKSGSDQYNVGLSQRRADAVKAYLAGRGVPDSAIGTEAFGESRPLVETADGVREPQNRRVEITFGPGSGM